MRISGTHEIYKNVINLVIKRILKIREKALIILYVAHFLEFDMRDDFKF